MAADPKVGLSSTIVFSIPGMPVAKARPRRGAQGQFYTPRESIAYEEQVRAAALDALRRADLADDAHYEGDVQVTIVFDFTPDNEQAIVTMSPCRNGLPARRPDLDNLIKSILDGLSQVAGIGLLRNDRQVVSLSARLVDRKKAVDRWTSPWKGD